MTWTPAVPWLPNSTSPYADGAYKGGDRPVGSFTPVILRTFEGGTVGQSAQSEFDNGGSQAVYADANPLDGDYIDSTALASNSNTFNFGGYLDLPVDLVQGDEIWIQVQIRPEDTFWTDSSPHLKFLRLREETSGGANSGYNDIYIEDTDGTIKFIKEGPDVWIKSNTGTATVGQWNKYEFYIKLHSDELEGAVRVWKDDALILDATTQTMNNSDGVNTEFLLFTYWNGEPALPASPHTVGIDNIVIGTSASPPTNTDTGGNVFIGDYI